MPQIPAEIEEYRDERWRREGMRQVETALDAERFIEQLGFADCMTEQERTSDLERASQGMGDEHGGSAR